MRRTLLMLTLVSLAAIAPAPASAATCTMSKAERGWIDNSLAAWRHMERRMVLPRQTAPTIVLFNQSCRFERRAGGTVWVGERHKGTIRLPDGGRAPAQVTSFAGNNEKTHEPFFVMALPSVWSAAKLPIARTPLGLTAVFLHEFSHTRQTPALAPVFQAAGRLHKMEDDFSDDSLQKHFQSNAAYVADFERERDLLYAAAIELDPAKARALARQALAAMEARQKRWFVGPEAYWKAYDDLFLTMEGFGQWVAYAWLSDPKGGGMSGEAARQRMRGSRKWWSQEEGLALFLVINRFVPHWPQRAFAVRPAQGIDLLREAVAR